ncbi:MAG: DUF4870 domain-containing protein [Selenomonadaceae bacterium]|nr:DUF4870 domain-containing protein [Selenomonadaceae bacterium]
MEIDGKQKTLAIAAHISYLFFGVGYVLVPLFIYLYFDKKDDFVANHAKQALLAQAICGIVGAIIGILAFIVVGLLLAPVGIVLGVVWFVCSFIGAWKALNGESYHYPLLG